MMMITTQQQPLTRFLSASNPFEGLVGFRRLFDEPFATDAEGGCCSSVVEREWRPLVDVVETKESILLKVEVPGVKQQDINISVEENTLTIKGERKQESQVNEGDYSRFERTYGAFQRSVLLPPTVDADRVKASYKDGVLEIQLPKKEEAKAKIVPVEAA
jgi:HSP20 family protein